MYGVSKNIRAVHADTGQERSLRNAGLHMESLDSGITDKYSIRKVRIIHRRCLFFYNASVVHSNGRSGGRSGSVYKWCDVGRIFGSGFR